MSTGTNAEGLFDSSDTSKAFVTTLSGRIWIPEDPDDTVGFRGVTITLDDDSDKEVSKDIGLNIL